METTWDNVKDHYAHGVKIVPGLRILDYDYKETSIVKPVPYGNPAEPQWFYTERGMVDVSRIVKVL